MSVSKGVWGKLLLPAKILAWIFSIFVAVVIIWLVIGALT